MKKGPSPYGAPTEEQQAVELMVRLRAGGRSLRNIAATLDAADYPTPGKSGRWSAASVKRILDREE